VIEEIIENTFLIGGMIFVYMLLSLLDKLIGLTKRIIIIVIVFLIFLPEQTKEFILYATGISL